MVLQSVFRVGLAKKAAERERKLLRRKAELDEQERQYYSEEARRLRAQFVQVSFRVYRAEDERDSDTSDDDAGSDLEAMMLGGSDDDDDLPSSDDESLDNRASGASGSDSDAGDQPSSRRRRRSGGSDSSHAQAPTATADDGAATAAAGVESGSESAVEAVPVSAAAAIVVKPPAPATGWLVDFQIVYTRAVMPWGWEEVPDGSGDVYYYHPGTGETAWERPEYSFRYVVCDAGLRRPLDSNTCLEQRPTGSSGIPSCLAWAHGQTAVQEGARQACRRAAGHRLQRGGDSGACCGVDCTARCLPASSIVMRARWCMLLDAGVAYRMRRWTRLYNREPKWRGSDTVMRASPSNSGSQESAVTPRWLLSATCTCHRHPTV